MEIHIIRHTPVEIEPGTCYGQSDVLPNKEMDFYVKKYLNDTKHDYDLILSSPLKRCTLLTETLGYNANKTDNRLMEMNFGDWELKKWNDIPRSASENWMNNYDTIAPPNGESMNDLYQRIVSFYQWIKEQDAKKVLIVTHAGPIRCFWALILEISLKNAMKIPISFGETLIINTTYDTIQRKA